MPKVEIEETDFLNAKTITGAVNEMMAHPAVRKMLLQARKLANPNIVIPELDTAAPILSEVAEVRRMLEEERSARAAEKAEREQQAHLATARAGRDRQRTTLRAEGWRDEGIAEIEKFADESGVYDLVIAASHWEKLHPPPTPVQPGGTGWNFYETPPAEDTFIKAMLDSKGEDDHALNLEIGAALKDHRAAVAGGRR